MTDKIVSLQKLESLALDNCSLTSMPSLYGMTKLNTVTLPNNRLSELNGLMNLRQLYLYNNLFTAIPSQVEPDALVRIYMNYNPVKNLNDITSYTNLTEIRLSRTDISQIPEAIGDLEKLSFLDFSFTKITQIPESILKLTRLQFLVLSGNAFLAEDINTIKMKFSPTKVQLLI